MTCVWLLLWCAGHLALYRGLVAGAARFYHVDLRQLIVTKPWRLAIPSAMHLIVVVVAAWGMAAVLGLPLGWVDGLSVSDWRHVLPALGLALLPATAALLVGRWLFGSVIVLRPPSLAPIGVAAPTGLTLAFLLNAATEEVVFRFVPVHLVGAGVWAFAIPPLAFAGIHFGSGVRPSLSRVVHLVAGAAFFYAIFIAQGLTAAILAHAIVNLSVSLTDGDWQVGAVCQVLHQRASTRHYLNSVGFALAACGVVLL